MITYLLHTVHFKSFKYFARVFDHDWFLSFNREIAFSYLAGALISTVFSILFSLLFYASAAVSDQLKNARLTSSNSASHLRGLHSVHPTSGSLHAQDPLEAALLAAARGQHGTGIPGKVYWSRSVWWKTATSEASGINQNNCKQQSDQIQVVWLFFVFVLFLNFFMVMPPLWYFFDTTATVNTYLQYFYYDNTVLCTTTTIVQPLLYSIFRRLLKIFFAFACWKLLHR